MKKKIHKILGVGLTLVLVLTFAIGVAVPVAAADYEENDWGTWGLPAVEPDTEVGPMAIAPDGTLYAAVYNYDASGDWGVMKSEAEDNGYTWDETELDDANGLISQIVVSPNYEEDETVYVAVYQDGTSGYGVVYRLEEAGEGDVTAIKDMVDSYGTTASELFSMDVWTDEDDYNWILVGTELDVFVLMDKRFEDWRDQELATYGDEWVAYEVAFAPDFDTSDLIWAVVDDDSYYGSPDDFLVTSTVSPGKWGQEIGEVDLGVADGDLTATPFLDIDFPDDYDSDPDSGNCIIYVGLTSPDGGDVYQIEGVEAPDPSFAIALGVDEDITSIAVSGDFGDEVILAGELDNPIVWISDDGGDTWDEADKNPTGYGWTHVYMEADIVWGGELFDVEESTSFVSTVGDEGAVSRSDPNEEGDLVYNQVGLIDTDIDYIEDLGFHPDFTDTPTFMMITWDDGNETESLWLTENGDEDEPDYIRVLCGNPAGVPANFEGWFWGVGFSQDGEAIYIHGEDDGGHSSIWKSTDDGQTFGNERNVGDGHVWINDAVITDEDTIYAATDDGFYMTKRSGTSWSSTDTDGALNSIALSPDFDEDDIIIVGDTDGDVYTSDDAGDTFHNVGSGLVDTANVFVAFDAYFAVEDADGYWLIYAADDAGSEIQVGEVIDIDDVDWDDLEDDENEDSQAVFCGGLQVVAEDNALYALSTAEAGAGSTLEVDAEGSLTVEGDISGATGTDTLDEDITSIVGDFEDNEVLTVTDSALEADSATQVSGTVEVEGASSGASGQFNVTLTFVAQTATASGTVNITGDTSAATGTFTLTADSVTILSGTFNNGEVLNITGISLTITPGVPDTVSGTLTVQGASSGATGNITVTAEPVAVIAGIFVAETASVTSSALTVTATSGVNFTPGETCSVIGSDLEANVTGAAEEVGEEAALYRLLLHEDNSEWESADDRDLVAPMGLWVTAGTNVLWTIDMDDAELWNLEDTCSEQVELDSPPDDYMSDSTDSIPLAWDEVRDADEYEYHAEGAGVADIDGDTDDTDVVVAITSSAVYDWMVRVAPGEPWHSRWSDEWTFSTALGEPMFAPTLYAPENGDADVVLAPAFSWETAKNADSYAFMLADNPAFTTPIVDTIVDSDAFQPDITLDYEGTYYWKVQALREGVAISRWSDVSVFTAVAEVVVVYTCPVDGLTFDTEAELQAHWNAVHAPVAPTTPAYIWVIIAVGALLVVAMLILIVRTRRVV